MFQDILSSIEQRKDEFIRDLETIVSQPSVSAKGEGIQECADMTKSLLQGLGFKTTVVPIADGNPVMFGEVSSSRSNKTLLLYNHYDVQPVEPLEEWKTQPFKAEIIDGKIYGRGVADDKGDLIARICALRVLLEKFGEPPMSIKWVIEGEEEIGSPHLHDFVNQYKGRLKADACLWEGSDLDHKGRLQFYLGVKGILYVELLAKTSEGDRHSMYAPIIPNPTWKLVWTLEQMKSRDERILIPGFYQQVKRPTKKDIRALEKIEFDSRETLRLLRVKQYLDGLKGKKLLERLIYSPTCNIAGFGSGHTGKGSKTIVPGKAFVKIDFRLVPNQRADDILRKFRKYLSRKGLKDIEITVHGKEDPARTSIDTDIVRVASDACKTVYGTEPNVWPSMYGTGPMALFNNIAKVPSVMANAVSYTGSSYHAPNEHIYVEHYIRGIKHLATLFTMMGQK